MDRFLIVCYQRAGSHLLASCLNSHPDIWCNGEIGVHDEVAGYREGAPGAIVMYNGFTRYFDQYAPDRVIHLTRELSAQARSDLRNAAGRKLRGRKHRAHVKDEPGPQPPEVGDEAVARHVRSLKRRRERIARRLEQAGLPVLNLTYEEMTRRREIECLPESVSRKLTDFLEVKPRRLCTNLKRTGYGIPSSS